MLFFSFLEHQSCPSEPAQQLLSQASIKPEDPEPVRPGSTEKPIKTLTRTSAAPDQFMTSSSLTGAVSHTSSQSRENLSTKLFSFRSFFPFIFVCCAFPQIAAHPVSHLFAPIFQLHASRGWATPQTTETRPQQQIFYIHQFTPSEEFMRSTSSVLAPRRR